MTIIDDMNWRYATKKFDKSKKISPEQFETLLEVLRLAPSSYGLQPLHYLVIENPEIRQKLRLKSWNQAQVTDASHLIVMCSFADLSPEHIDSHVQNAAKIKGVDVSELAGYGDFVKKEIAKLSREEISTWNSKQAYIALGHVLHACAQMRIDALPMEGFEPAAYDEILQLSSRNLKATLVCAIGYRSEDDAAQHGKKVRKELADLVEIMA
jgi:nitroreductase